MQMVTVTLITVLYMMVGHQSWWRMLHEDPDAQENPELAWAYNEATPFHIYATFVVLWLPLNILDEISAIVSRFRQVA